MQAEVEPLVQFFYEVCGEKGRGDLYVLMHKKVELP
jgi:hypothetical protein